MKVLSGIGVAALGLALFATPAGAADACPESSSTACSSEVKAVELDPTPTTPAVATPAAAAVTPAAPAVAAKQQLPVTGGDAASIAGIGAGLVAAGGVLVLRARRPAAE